MVWFIHCDFFWFEHQLGHLQFLTSLVCPAALLKTLCSSIFIKTRCSNVFQWHRAGKEEKLVINKTICQMSHDWKTDWRRPTQHLLWAHPDILITVVSSSDVMLITVIQILVQLAMILTKWLWYVKMLSFIQFVFNYRIQQQFQITLILHRWIRGEGLIYNTEIRLLEKWSTMLCISSRWSTAVNKHHSTANESQIFDIRWK